MAAGIWTKCYYLWLFLYAIYNKKSIEENIVVMPFPGFLDNDTYQTFQIGREFLDIFNIANQKLGRKVENKLKVL